MKYSDAARASTDVDFQQLWSAFRRRWLAATIIFGSILGLSILVSLKVKPSYVAQGKLLFKKISLTSGLTGVESANQELTPLTMSTNPVVTEIEVVRSMPLLQKTIEGLKLKDKKGQPLAPENLKNKLKLKHVGGSDVLLISYDSKNPTEAAAVINKLMELYIDNNIFNNRSKAAAAAKFIENQLPGAEANVRKTDAALRKFKEENNIVALEEESKSAVEFLNDLDSQILKVQSGLANANAKAKLLQEQTGIRQQDAIAVTSLSQSAGVQKLLEELQQVESQLVLQSTRFSEQNPAIIDLKSKKAALNKLLQERIMQVVNNQQQADARNLQMGGTKQELIRDFVQAEAERLGLSRQLGVLNKTQLAYKERANNLPKLEQQQRELQRKQEVAQFSYQGLLRTLQEVRLAENQNLGNAQIIEQAIVPNKPVLTNKLIIVVMGALTGLLGAAVTIVLLEVRDTSIKTLKEAKDLFGYTLVGAIPAFKKKPLPRGKKAEWTLPELPVRDLPNSLLSETYRMLQANLKFLSYDKPLKLIAVTSSVPKEGKSTTSANLACAIAQLGNRVLLVDADLRRPMQHHIWELTNIVGLSDVLIGQADFKVAVTEAMPNLDILTAGAMPPNPMALLGSKRMASFMEYIAQYYDYVIIDTPPLVLAADALTLGKMADGVLLVSRPGVLDIHSATTAKDLLANSGNNILGLVVNGLVPKNESGSFFYFSKEYSHEQTPRKEVTSV